MIFRNGKYLLDDVNGEVRMECKVSGNPEFCAYLNSLSPYDDYSLHECAMERYIYKKLIFA